MGSKSNEKGQDLGKSDLIEEEFKDEDHVGNKVNKYRQNQLKASNKRGAFNSKDRDDSFEMNKQHMENNHYDRSNLAPIVLP